MRQALPPSGEKNDYRLRSMAWSVISRISKKILLLISWGGINNCRIQSPVRLYWWPFSWYWYRTSYNFDLANSVSSNREYMSEISFAKYALACGLLTYRYRSVEVECQQVSDLVSRSPLTEQMMFTLNVGVRRPLSNVNGSATRVTALANSKPLSWYSIWSKASIRRHIRKNALVERILKEKGHMWCEGLYLCFLRNGIHISQDSSCCSRISTELSQVLVLHITKGNLENQHELQKSKAFCLWLQKNFKSLMWWDSGKKTRYLCLVYILNWSRVETAFMSSNKQGGNCSSPILFTWIPSVAAQAFNTSGSTATMATREELKLSPASRSTTLRCTRWCFQLRWKHE